MIQHKNIDPAKLQHVMEAISDEIRDPSSLQFRKLRDLGSYGICGEFNAKNGFGGYAGFTEFRVSEEYVGIMDPSDLPEMRELMLMAMGKCVTK